MESTFEGYDTPNGASNRIRSHPPSARSAEYATESDLKTNDSSEEFIESRDYQLIGGRSRRQRRKILKAKRRIFTPSGKSIDGKKALHEEHLACLQNFNCSEDETMDNVERWIAKHRNEFEKSRLAAQNVSPTNEETFKQVQSSSVSPTHEMVWVNALLPVQKNDQKNYINKLIPLLVPIGTTNIPISIVRENQQLFSAITNQTANSSQQRSNSQ